MMNTNELEKNRLLTKKDFEIFFEEHDLPLINKTNINELRSTFGVTHLIDGKYKDMRGNCFKCLTPLRVDYTKHKNYCMDC
jgi:hypothetical protein